jgi:hypothetical protein
MEGSREVAAGRRNAFPTLEEMAGQASTSNAGISPASSRKPNDRDKLHSSRARSPEKQAQDAAFQAQIERAMASGENPFMDRRRAAMRDDGSTSFTPETKLPSMCQLGATRKDSLDDSQAREANERFRGDGPESIHSSFVQIDKVETTPVRNAVQADQSFPTPSKSPPAVLFTPRRLNYSTQAAQAVPVAQQEELHRLRSEVREYRSKLRDAQLSSERNAADAAHNKTRLLEMESLRKQLQEQVDTQASEMDRLEVQAKDAQRQLLVRCEQQKRQFDEHKRAQDIAMVIARNEVTFMNVQRRDALAQVKSLKGREMQNDNDWQEERRQLSAEVDSLRADKKQAAQRIKQLEGERVDLEDANESLRSDLEREQKRRKDAVHREAVLRSELDEMQESSTRELALRKELTMLKNKVARLQDELDNERSRPNAEMEAVPTGKQKSSKPSGLPVASSSLKTAPTRQRSRRQMQEEVESSLIDESFEAPVVVAPPAPAALHSSSSEVKSRAEATTKSKVVAAQPTRQKDSQAKRAEESLSPIPKKRAAPERKQIVDNAQDDVVEEIGVSKPRKKILAKTTRPATSLLSRTAAGQRSSTTASASSDGFEKAKVTEPSQDETMRTPLLPSKRTRTVINVQPQTEVDVENETPVAPKAATKKVVTKPRLSEQAEATPMVRIDPEKKKRRKLLKAGSNVASDFLTSKGDADGGLAPTLNLPIELSPLKPGEQAPLNVTATARGRLGNGGTASTSAARSLFARH